MHLIKLLRSLFVPAIRELPEARTEELRMATQELGKASRAVEKHLVRISKSEQDPLGALVRDMRARRPGE